MRHDVCVTVHHQYNDVNNQQDESISTVAPVGSSVGALYQKLYIESKSDPENGRICRPKHVELI